MVMASYDFNHQLPRHGISILKFAAFDRASARALENAYGKYAAYVVKAEKGGSQDLTKISFEEHNLELDSDRYPVVPFVKPDEQLAEFMRQIVRLYITKHYCKSSYTYYWDNNYNGC